MSLQKDDPVYYKIEIQKLFDQAKMNGLEIELGLKEVTFIADNGDRASVKPKNL